MEYSSRSLAPSASTGSMHNQNTVTTTRVLNASPSADSLLKAAAARQQMLTSVSPVSVSPLKVQNGALGQSLSMTSLLSIESDSSAPPPVAPPRSAQLNTGEVLQAYLPLQAHQSPSHARLQGVQPARNPYESHAPRPVHQMPSMMGQQAFMQAPSGTVTQMAVVHPQAALSQREVPPPAPPPPQEPAAASDPSQSTWIIEEVIDFGTPVDEGMVRECEDSSYPLGCHSLTKAGTPRGGFIDGCVHNVCYDESQVESNNYKDGKELC